MFATITALVLSTAGLGFGAAGCVMAGRCAKRHRAFEAAARTQIGLVLQATAGQVQHIDALLNAQDNKAQMSTAILAERLAGLENMALEELITREEVSAAFAELAAIEQQRARQAALQQQGVGAVVNAGVRLAPTGPVVAAPVAAQSAEDPWINAAPPADPAKLLEEISAMNERLRQKIQGVGIAPAGQS